MCMTSALTYGWPLSAKLLGKARRGGREPNTLPSVLQLQSKEPVQDRGPPRFAHPAALETNELPFLYTKYIYIYCF